MITSAERRTLTGIARASLTARVAGQPYAVPAGEGALARHAGAFVTLRHRNALRGCIGCTESDEPLVEVVARCAAAAATEDPRFPPLAATDAPDVELEISVLGPLEPVAEVTDIVVGRHGLVVEAGTRRGLLLPQVATQWGWDREAFLAQTCVKAGLSRDAWKSGARIFKFDADVFAEE